MASSGEDADCSHLKMPPLPSVAKHVAEESTIAMKLKNITGPMWFVHSGLL